MYTQRPIPPGGMSIPQNYGGNAFRYPPIGGLEEAAPAAEEQPHCREEPIVAQEATAMQDGEDACDTKENAPRPALLFGHHRGEEELLLIGLFLLLAGDGVIGGGHEKPQGDILLYLLLLFFCG